MNLHPAGLCNFYSLMLSKKLAAGKEEIYVISSTRKWKIIGEKINALSEATE